MSFKNLVNALYAKDISRKIISAFRTKQKNGEYIGLVAPFGYLKSEDNKNKFVIDGQTTPVVQIMRCDSDSGKKLIKSMVLRTADRQGMC